MSNKKNIDNILDIISGEAHILIRDAIELERLQTAGANISEQFATASYRRFTQKILAKIINFVAAYKIKLPSSVVCSYNGLSQNIALKNIIDTTEFDTIGNSKVGIFMISPLDGMINFTRSIPIYCTGIAIFINKDDKIEPNQAIVYDVPNNKFYTATVGFGAFLNSAKLMSSTRSKIYTSSISVSGLESFIKEDPKNPETAKIAAKIKNITISAANHLSGIPSQLAACYLAAGKLDIVIEANLIDATTFIAGAIIAKEAGCFILNKNGDEVAINDIHLDKIIIITNRSVSDDIIKFLKS